MSFDRLTKGFFILLIRLYKSILSPYLRRACRYTPSCSEYMIQAIQKFGAIKGIKLGLARLARCHPYGGHGYDPVP